ncbi:transcriptional regulator, LacI family [Flavobacterium fluvii]|uniref:Transcriptional regulator, LacI family n=1 Tax=Flavobacterium fluvii TaxID=468056 RepID=A0A1M5HEQ8_9FLAO|nr:LacI family DNA-binding transcriptional regulator [Flavobacterium fluvii]SHG14322.1 transcriptional regulator, LacI family [Flavobacterium fluvii]
MSKEKKQQDNTILDIAEALKLSPATISRALNNGNYVKAETKKRVLDMAEKLGYRRNLMASSLRSNKTNTIGMIVPRIAMFFHAEVITTIQTQLHKLGYNLIISQSGDSLQMEKELANTMFSSRVDALIVACTLQTEDFSHFDVFVNSNTPLVFYDRVPTKPYKAIIVKGDDYRGGYLATQHLLELGCKKVALISGPLTTNLYIGRSMGYKKALAQYNIPENDDHIFYQLLTHENARKAMEKMFKGKVKPDAVFASNDVTAIAVLEFAREHNIAVPEELKIVGYSNDSRTEIIRPSITTIEQFPKEVGKKIVEELMKKLTKKTNETDTIVQDEESIIPVQLIRRMST